MKEQYIISNSKHPKEGIFFGIKNEATNLYTIECDLSENRKKKKKNPWSYDILLMEREKPKKEEERGQIPTSINILSILKVTSVTVTEAFAANEQSAHKHRDDCSPLGGHLGHVGVHVILVGLWLIGPITPTPPLVMVTGP